MLLIQLHCKRYSSLMHVINTLSGLMNLFDVAARNAAEVERSNWLFKPFNC